MPPDAFPLREALLLVNHHAGRVVATLVRRQGLRFSLLLLLLDDDAALSCSPQGLELLEKACGLPVRLLEDPSSSFLALETYRAHREGREFVLSRGRKLP